MKLLWGRPATTRRKAALQASLSAAATVPGCATVGYKVGGTATTTPTSAGSFLITSLSRETSGKTSRPAMVAAGGGSFGLLISWNSPGGQMSLKVPAGSVRSRRPRPIESLWKACSIADQEISRPAYTTDLFP